MKYIKKFESNSLIYPERVNLKRVVKDIATDITDLGYKMQFLFFREYIEVVIVTQSDDNSDEHYIDVKKEDMNIILDTFKRIVNYLESNGFKCLTKLEFIEEMLPRTVRCVLKFVDVKKLKKPNW